MEITLTDAEQVIGVLLTVAIMQLMKKPFKENPRVILAIRIAFFVSTAIQVLLALYIKRRIAQVNNQKKFKHKQEASLLNNFEGSEHETEITYAEYDNAEVTKVIRSVGFMGILYAILALKFMNTQPMLLQTLGLFKSLALSPLYRAYLYGMDIERPFDKNLLFPKKKETPTVTPVERKKKKEE
ncbi:phosphate transporter (Pho88) [Glugoides intestinalis]